MLFKFLMKSPKAEKYEFLHNYSSTVCLSSVFLHFVAGFFFILSLVCFFLPFSPSLFALLESWNFLDLSESNSILNGNSLQMEMHNTSGKVLREWEKERTSERWRESEKERWSNVSAYLVRSTLYLGGNGDNSNRTQATEDET